MWVNQLDNYHFIGIGGIGMSALARILLQRGCEVTGSDRSSSFITEQLANRGATIFKGHSEENLPAQGKIVISSDVKKDNPEYCAAVNAKMAILHRSDLLHLLMQTSKGIAITGTHGKTTTSALLTWVLIEAALDPSFAIGGWLPRLETNSASGQGDYFIAEADESDGTFTKYFPYAAIITNIDCDHMDHFGTETNLLEAFKLFSSQVSDHLFWCGDAVKGLALPGVSFGFGPHNDLKIESSSQETWSSVFDLSWRGESYREIELALPGNHNILNAAAVFGLAITLGLDPLLIRQAFRSFPGVKRRCERKCNERGVVVIDDYAHHPVELAATLKAVRSAVGERRLIAVFQPHRFSRTKQCIGQYEQIFCQADEVIITDIYAGGEEPIEGVSSELILEELKRSHCAVRYIPRNSLRTTLLAICRPHDVIITLGAGDITKVGTELAEHFQQQSPKRYTVGVICGGISVEHDISLLSTTEILPHLKADFYEVKLFKISREGRWSYGEEMERLSKLQPFSEVFTSLVSCDVILPLLHGTNGEDGTIQGFLEVMGKAYIGGGHRSCAVCMDKVLTKQVARSIGLSVGAFTSFSKWQWEQEKRGCLEAMQELSLPFFVKARHLGSSIGVYRVSSLEEIEQAVHAVLSIDSHVIAEAEMAMREIEFAAIGNEKVVVLPPGEIFSAGAIHTFEGKYVSDQATPDTERADLPPHVIEEGRDLVRRIYRATGCAGLARVDFFVDETYTFWLNEINPMPGFTKNSMFPKLCLANQISLADLFNQLVILALARQRANRQIGLCV